MMGLGSEKNVFVIFAVGGLAGPCDEERVAIKMLQGSGGGAL